MGRKKVHFSRKSQAEFARIFTSWCETKSAWEVWADFITMSALSISNAFDQKGTAHDAREQEYLDTIGRYTKKQQQIFSELFALLVNALEEDPEQDFLGELFMGLDLGDHWKGQFFTPYNVCKMIAAMIISDREQQIERHGWTTVHDPCCGAGALLIAARNEMIKRGYGPEQALYVAQDIDRTAALMCYLQLSLLGCAGYVVVGNSLTNPLTSPNGSALLSVPSDEHEIWFMPAFYDDTWVFRIQLEGIKWLVTEAGNEMEKQDNCYSDCDGKKSSDIKTES